MVGPIVDTEYERLSSTLKVFDNHPCPPALTAYKQPKNIAVGPWNK